MRWKYLSCLVNIDNLDQFAFSHAMVPTPLLLGNGVLRVFFSSRDKAGIGRPRFIDFEIDHNFEPIRYSDSIILDLGGPGTFDDNGILVSSVVQDSQGQLLMYYGGFELSTKIRYKIFTGLAISNNMGETFTRYSEIPILDRNSQELFFRGGAFVERKEDTYEMLYVGGSSWKILKNSTKPIYSIRSASSLDGKLWQSGKSILEPSSEMEHGFGRPYKVNWANREFIYYSIRDVLSENYRIGYAEIVQDEIYRQDGLFNIFNGDELIPNVGIMYASFFSWNGNLYMLFNEDDFGATGIHLAILENLD